MYADITASSSSHDGNYDGDLCFVSLASQCQLGGDHHLLDQETEDKCAGWFWSRARNATEARDEIK